MKKSQLMVVIVFLCIAFLCVLSATKLSALSYEALSLADKEYIYETYCTIYRAVVDTTEVVYGQMMQNMQLTSYIEEQFRLYPDVLIKIIEEGDKANWYKGFNQLHILLRKIIFKKACSHRYYVEATKSSNEHMEYIVEYEKYLRWKYQLSFITFSKIIIEGADSDWDSGISAVKQNLEKYIEENKEERELIDRISKKKNWRR